MDKQPTLGVLESLLSNAKEYVDIKIELLKLKIADKAYMALSAIIALVVFGIILLLIFLFINIGLALLIGDFLGKTYWGFFIMSGVYVIGGFILFFTKNKMIKGHINAMSFIKKYF